MSGNTLEEGEKEKHMKFEIRNCWTNEVQITAEISCGEEESYGIKLGAAVKWAIEHNANLRAANLSNANLSNANLSNANLSNANLSNANLRAANLSNANLSAANLSNANLSDANLRAANLSAAKNLRLPTGETWKEYLEITVPALLTAGGKKLEEVATEEHWNCHSWDNCPMAAAFDVSSEEKTPILLRPRVRQFVQLFDAKQIRLEDVRPK